MMLQRDPNRGLEREPGRGQQSDPAPGAAVPTAAGAGAIVVARLPLLGPVIGWTRPIGRGVMRSRVWACLDGYESETPLAMMTLGWDRNRDEMRSGSVRLWKLNAVSLSRAGLERRLHIGLADVLLPIEAPDYLVRVVALHRCIRLPCADPAILLAGHLSPEDRGAEGWRPEVALGHQLLALVAAGATAAEADAVAAARPVAAGDSWPQPQPIDVAGLLPGPRSRQAVRAWLDEFARQALQGLAQSRTAAAEFERLRLIAAAPLLRRPRYDRRVEESAAVPGPAVRASMRPVAGSSPATRRTLRFAAGCCRYPGTPFERDRADAAIEMLAQLARCPDGPAFAIFSGDQIYADATAGVFETQGRREKVAARYESAFATPAFRELARRIPLYMTADDHEISDGWSMPSTHAPHLAPGDVFRNDRLRQWAGQLFLAYQRMHGPPPAQGAVNWYRFAVAGVHFFVMDTRFERGFAEDAAPPPLCSGAQLAALGRWLEEVEQRQPGAPKFIVSGSVYAPGLAEWDGLPGERMRGDSWQGYASERAEVARLIAKAGADNVVFLSGDYHCAAVASVEWLDPVAGRPLDLRAWSIVSPPLYAPFPFANSRVEDVLPEEEIRDPSANSAHALLARCRARAFNRHGFAIVCVTHGGGERPVIEVEFVDPFARDRAERSCLVSVSDPRVAPGRSAQVACDPASS
jgi:hypothetical protein